MQIQCVYLDVDKNQISMANVTYKCSIYHQELKSIQQHFHIKFKINDITKIVFFCVRVVYLEGM